MGWESVSLSDTKIERPAPVPAGKGYVFTLQPGASIRINPYNGIEELNVRFDVTEGEYAGRPMFATYPDPTAVTKSGKSLAWSAQALKKLEISLGVDALPGENPSGYLNRVALNGNARITADVIPGKVYKDSKTNEEKTEDPFFGIFTVGPAA